MSISRRNFLTNGLAVGLGFYGLQKFAHTPLKAANSKQMLNFKAGYGELIKDPKGILDLPKGFSYKIISAAGKQMFDGYTVPTKMDGMATFMIGGKTVIIRNHEIDPGAFGTGAFGKNNELLKRIDKKLIYDNGFEDTVALGGTTTIIYDTNTQKVEKEFLSLIGTLRNCAGGPTPWNSWITCEETVVTKSDKFMKNHGYNFEVPATINPKIAEPIPLIEMGRFNHEAVCLEPKSGIVYQTEDAHDGLIYRYLPNQKGNLAKGGKLQALAIKGQKSYDTRNWGAESNNHITIKNQRYLVEWVDLDNVNPSEDDLRLRGLNKGAAKFARGEGMWFGNNEVYFACTNGGAKKVGQVFRYIPSDFEGTIKEKDNPGTLELFIESENSDIIRNCDNLTVSPWGDVILCEDDDSPRIVGVTPKGEIYHIAHNVGYKSELTGGCFSPDGSTFFVNIQHAGFTLAITGDWKK